MQRAFIPIVDHVCAPCVAGQFRKVALFASAWAAKVSPTTVARQLKTIDRYICEHGLELSR